MSVPRIGRPDRLAALALLARADPVARFLESSDVAEQAPRAAGGARRACRTDVCNQRRRESRHMIAAIYARKSTDDSDRTEQGRTTR